MITDPYGREAATEITLDDGKRYALSLIGSGTSNMVYTTERGDIIKEFAPVVGGVPVCRRDVKNRPMTVITEGQSELILRSVEERARRFYGESNTINSLFESFRLSNDNMMINPKMKDSSLGKVQLSPFTGGVVMSDYFLSLKERADFSIYLKEVLTVSAALFEELSRYYHKDTEAIDPTSDDELDRVIINLDIKPDNLYTINFNGRSVGVRNLDFGSTRRVGELRRILHSCIGVSNDYELDRIASEVNTRYFASSRQYYSEEAVRRVICSYLKTGNDENLLSDLRHLDTVAGMKQIIYLLKEVLPEDTVNGITSLAISEDEKLMKLYTEVMVRSAPFGRMHNLYREYYLFCKLYELLASNIFGRRKVRCSASEAAMRIKEIIAVLTGEIGSLVSDDRIKNALIAAKERDVDNRTLMENGLYTVSDILAFCERLWPRKLVSAPELLFYLFTGEVYTEQV